VVATLALFLALSGGVVLAANKITSKQIGKGAIKNRNLGRNAVRAKNLAKNSVTSAKIANGAVENADIADGSVNFAKLTAGTTVVASSSTGTIPANQERPVAFNPPLSATPVPGQPLTLHLEAHGSLARKEPTNLCDVIPMPVVNGNPMLMIGLEFQLLDEDSLGQSHGNPVSEISFPIGLTQPGVPQNVSLYVVSVLGNCTANSTFLVSAVITQAK
jgi:hypothetical protein